MKNHQFLVYHDLALNNDGEQSITLEEDVVLPCGQILHKAGTKVNPLEHMDLKRSLFFIDSRQPVQVKWLKAQLTVSNLEISNNLADQKELIEDRIILVGGSALKLKEELGKEHVDKVYFNQVGELTTKFNIKAIPSDSLARRLQDKDRRN